MKRALVMMMGFMVATPAVADCFVVREGSRVVQQTGECTTRHAPCSTFKIPISLMGYDAGILQDENKPVLPFKDGYAAWMPNWKQPHSPALWMQNSTVWYSQEITKTLGAKQFSAYVNTLDYGNKDVSGDKGKNNGLTRSWLSSSLAISPMEQLDFVQNLSTGRLPVSAHAQEMTRNIMNMGKLEDGWTLYGKTGSGTQKNAEGKLQNGMHFGWFVGWVEKGDRKIAFVKLIVDDEKMQTYAGPRARDAVKRELPALLHQQ